MISRNVVLPGRVSLIVNDLSTTSASVAPSDSNLDRKVHEFNANRAMPWSLRVCSEETCSVYRCNLTTSRVTSKSTVVHEAAFASVLRTSGWRSTVEVSTAGLRKPVGEIYPARAYLEMIVDAGCPIALSSDAHVPEDLGFGYDRALELLSEVGVGEICVFEGRERRLEPVG